MLRGNKNEYDSQWICRVGVFECSDFPNLSFLTAFIAANP
jgi:hypothetical protein